ncbi:MAG: hypothetical protein A3J83_06020 [Elusimicrobia bacterium RIFOXYA2_FULL_40_6]|nr:MAG: hypothetical protein A3J83_06020 [Elusimicrobia bacterium RIFOXYA2_FULL_40_6]
MNINEALKILNLKDNGDLIKLEKAYRKLAMKYHPDRCPEKTKTKCREKFKKLTWARKIVEDYYKGAYNPDNDKEHGKEYEDYINRFYSDLFGD